MHSDGVFRVGFCASLVGFAPSASAAQRVGTPGGGDPDRIKAIALYTPDTRTRFTLTRDDNTDTRTYNTNTISSHI